MCFGMAIPKIDGHLSPIFVTLHCLPLCVQSVFQLILEHCKETFPQGTHSAIRPTLPLLDQYRRSLQNMFRGIDKRIAAKKLQPMLQAPPPHIAAKLRERQKSVS
jgi:hypothetical protein